MAIAIEYLLRKVLYRGRKAAGSTPSGVEERGSTMEFGKRIGWARMGLVVSAVLLVVMGVICFVGHSILPEAMHNPQLPEGYTWPAGELIGAVVIVIVGQLGSVAAVSRFYI